MENNIPIGKAAELFGVSTRTLRYYEQQGLLQSERRDGSDYRSYTPAELERLQAVLILRKLRVPLADIRSLLATDNNNEVFRALRARLAGLGAEMQKLAEVRAALQALLQALQQHTGSAVYHLPSIEAEVLQLAQALPTEPLLPPQTPPQENAYRPGDVRVVHLAGYTVASFHRVGTPCPEEETRAEMMRFMENTRLREVYPGFRSFGFNHPNGTQPDGSDHGYERWVTLPQGMPLPQGTTTKQFPGGRYAVRCIPFGHFEEWDRLLAWVNASPLYEPNLGAPETMQGLLEEELDACHLYQLPGEKIAKSSFLDLMLPIRNLQKS